MECFDCGVELAKEEVVKVKDGRRTLKLCEDCADVRREQGEIADLAEGAMQDMMGYKGSW